MESSIYLEHLGANGTVLDPSNESFDPVSDVILSINRSLLEKTQDIGNPFDQPFIKALLFVLYSVVFILIFFGNLAVILVTTLHWRMRKTATFCLFNLAIANLCVGVFCVYQNLSLFLIESWVFGDWMCKMYFFIMSLSYTASILILVVIAIERYVVIMYPLQGRWLMTTGKLQIAIAVVWILSGVICFHRFYSVSTSENPMPGGGVEIICSPNVLLHNHKAVDLANFLLLFLLPLFVISVLYTRVGLYLKTYSLSFPALNVTPTGTRSSTEMETVDRALSNLTPLPELRRSSTNTICIPVPLASTEGPGSSAMHPRLLKRSQSWTECNGRTYPTESNNGFPSTSWIRKAKSNDLLVSGTKSKEAQRHQGPSSSDLVLNNGEIEDLGLPGNNKKFETDRSNTSPNLDPPHTDGRSNHLEMTTMRTSMQRTEMRNQVELSRLNFSRRLHNIVQHGRMNNNSPRSHRDLTSNQHCQPNANHQAVIRMLIVIVITFALCNFPFHLRKMCQNYFAPCYLDHPLFELLTPATFLTMYANCAINPFIYALMHKRFRLCFVELLSRGCRRIERRY